MSPWLFNICMDGVIREERENVGEVVVKLWDDVRKWYTELLMFANDKVLFGE